MVKSLKKILTGDSLPPPVVSASNDKSKKISAEFGVKKHFEILTFADTSYSLKRGAGTNSFVSSRSNYNDNPMKSLLSHLEISASFMIENNIGDHSYCTTKCIQIDQIVRTSLRIINNRCSSLWRLDRESSFMQDSCLLYDDICFMIKAFDQLAMSLKTFMARSIEMGSVTPKFRSRKLLDKTRLYEEVEFGLNSNILAIHSQLISLVSCIFPSIIIRIESAIAFHLTNESKNIFSEYLKHDSFSGVTSRRVGDGNKRNDSIIFGILDKKLLHPDFVAIREHCSFFPIMNIISVGLNSILQSLLVFILHNKLRFNHEGVIIFYSLIIKVQNRLLSIKQELLLSKNCIHRDTNFSIIQDKDPWVKLNIILGILQTGKLSPSFISDSNGGNNGKKTKVLNKGESFKLYSSISPEYDSSLIHQKSKKLHQFFKLLSCESARKLTPEVEEQIDNNYNVLASAIVPNLNSSESNHETRVRLPVIDSRGKDVIGDRLNSYRYSNRDVINISCRFILDSLGIICRSSKKSNMLGNSMEIEHTNWIPLAAMRPDGTATYTISCWPSPSICYSRKTAKTSSVSISVVVNLDNL